MSRKTRPELQIDVTFVSDATKLVKDLQSATKGLKLNSPLTKEFESNLNRSFKDTLGNLNKMAEGLSKQGFNSKQYTEFFNNMNLKIRESTKFIGGLKEGLQNIFKSQENKDAIKQLETYKKQLEEINKLMTAQKGAETRRDTAIQKMKDETGLDYNLSKRMISSIGGRKANKQALTKSQQEWLDSNKIDEEKLKRVLELLKQINAQNAKIDDQNKRAKSLTDQSTVAGAEGFLTKQIGKLDGTVISSNTMKEWMALLSQLDGLIKQVAASGDNLNMAFNDEMPRASKEAEKLAQATSTIKEIFGQFGIALSAATVVRAFQNLGREAFNFYKSLDSALNEIYVVSDLTINNVNQLKSNFINMAKDTGMAIDDITRSATLFYQQGLSTKEVMTMTEVTSQFAKVAGIDATDAADKLTAAVNGYCLAAEDASTVADKFNKVAAASAADINELSTAFSKAAAQANQAGVGMDNYLAYIATMVEATREAPENIGTSLKTIMSRMQQVKEAGTTEDGETDVNNVETALRSVGVALRDANGELRDLEEVFADLGPRWQSLDRNTQAYLGTIIAGTRQQSRFITLMQNWDRVLELSEESANSAGQQALMHAKSMDSIESRMQQFKVAWQEFVSNLADSDLFKGLFSGLTKIIDLFNSGNQPIILLSSAIGLLSTKLKDLQAPITQRVKDLGKLFKEVREGMKNGFGYLTFKNMDEKNAALSKVQTKQEGINAALTSKFNELGELTVQEQLVTSEKEQNQLAEKRRRLEEEIARLKGQQTELTKQENNINNAKIGKFAGAKAVAGKVGQLGLPIGLGLQTAGMIASGTDTNLAGVLGAAGSAVTAAGQFATGNWIGGAISAGMAIYQGFQAWENWDENIAAKLTDSVNEVTNAMQDLTNTATRSKGVKSLLDDYYELHNKTYLTTEEQEKLNATVQTLGESLDVEILTDNYGNLALNISEVNKEYENMLLKQEEALKKMKELEEEGLKKSQQGIGNDNSRQDFYQELYNANRNNYKSLLNGVQDGLTDSTRVISKTLYDTFNSAFKSSLEDHITENLEYFGANGLADSFNKLESGIMKKLDDSSDWNYLYKEIEYFQANINDLSWDEFVVKFEDAFGTWRKEIGLTTDEWLVLKDSIQSTIYNGQKEYINFMNTYDDSAGSDYKLYEERYNEVSKTVKEKLGVNDKDFRTGNGISENGYNTIREYEGFEEIYDRWVELGKKFNKVDVWYEYIGLGNTQGVYGEYTLEEIEAMLVEYDEAYEKYEEMKKKFEKDGGAKTLYDALSGLTGNTAQKITSIGSIYDRTDFYKDSKGESVDDYKKVSQENKDDMNSFNALIAEVIQNADDYVNDSDIGLAMLQKINEQLANGDLSDGVKAQLEKVKKEIEEEMPRTSTFTWSGIAKSLDKYSSALQTTNKALEELNETGAISFETFEDLAKTLDSLSIEDIYASFDANNAEEAMQYVEGLMSAMDNLELKYDANTGAIQMNADALNYLQDAQERAAKGKIKNTIKELAASKATAESQVAYIEAQMAAVKAMMDYMTLQGDKQISVQDMMSAANSAYTSAFGTEMANVSNNYKAITGDSLEWAETTIHHIADVTDAWSKYWAAVKGGAVNAAELKKTAEDLAKGYFGSADDFFEGSNIKISEADGVVANSEQGKAYYKQLEAYYEGLRKAKVQYSKTVTMYEGSISLLNSLYNADLSKWGSGSKDKAVKEYISQLEEMLDLITHIERENQKLSLYKNLYDIQTGKKAVDNLRTQIELVEHLTEDYEKAYNLQVNRLKLQAQQIKDAYAGVVEFAEDGSYKINDAAYDRLNDDNKKSLDELVETYDDLIDKTDEYYDNLISSMGEEKELRQSYVDLYIEAEEELVEAIKEREQKILDNKLEAIDKEIEAIERASEARRKAREEESNAQELSSMQTDLQRALMDSSGASASQILEIQKQMKEKQQEMADNSFDTMVDDMKQQLEDEKEMEQQLFDERLEEMDWYWDEVDRIMSEGTNSILETMKMYLSDYTEASELQQTELLKGWTDTFDRATEIGKSGAKEMQGVIVDLQKIINGVDIDSDLQYLIGVAPKGYSTTDVMTNQSYKYTTMKKYAGGGMSYTTGPAWLDGTASHPEAVLNAMQTKAFLSFTDDLAALRAEGGVSTSSSVIIDNISFNVESMSSVADGEKAFNTFVDKFKEIGAKQGISILGTANRN
jgi:TP901 family phage tail tape measure protein